MSEIKMEISENQTVTSGMDSGRLDGPEDFFWPPENAEDRIRMKLLEFAAELQKIKKTRENS